MNNCCFNGTLKGVKQINTVSGRATKVKNKAIKIAGEIISMSCKGKHNKINQKLLLYTSFSQTTDYKRDTKRSVHFSCLHLLRIQVS